MLTREPSAVKIGEFPTIQTENGWKVDGGEKGEIEIYTSVEEVQKHL